MTTRSILGLMYTLQSLRQLGEDPAPVLERHGLDASKLDPRMQIERTLELKINCELSEHLRDPLAGLKTGRHFAFTGYGPLTMLLLSSEDARQAFELGIRFQQLTYLYGTLRLEPGEQQSALVLDLLPLPPKAFRFRMDLEMAGTYKLAMDIRAAVGVNMLPERIDLPYPRPPEAAAYEAHFRCPVQFGAPVARAWLRNDAFRQRFSTHDPAAQSLYLGLCEQQLLQQENSSLDTLSERVALHLDLFSAELPDAATVASRFGLSERTFRRRLSEEGSNFRQLVNEAHYRRAQHLLHHTKLSIEEISTQLGYAEPSAFTHAFQRWAGMTPQAFRATR